MSKNILFRHISFSIKDTVFRSFVLKMDVDIFHFSLKRVEILGVGSETW